MSVNNQLQLVLSHVDHSSGGLFSRCEEQDSENGHLKLRTDTNKSTANRLDQTMPAELHIQDMVIIIRLKRKKEREIF